MPKFMPYPWGDTHYIQELCHLGELEGSPVAEMWLGAHPLASSELFSDQGAVSLVEAIAADPASHLGQARGVYQNRLPFLCKVLAAAKPLSIQVHPDKATAEMGFTAENARGMALNDPRRSYRDDNHKPELIMALTPFSLMCGFRPYREIADLLSGLGLDKEYPQAADFILQPSEQTLRTLYRDVVLGSHGLEPQLLQEMFSRSKPQAHTAENAVNTCRLLLQHFPRDKAVLTPLFLNVITLEPGQALFIDAGVLHSYLQGAGIELMANSDNVIRGGLTDKYINPEALIQVAHFRPRQPQILSPQCSKNGSSRQWLYPEVAREFSLQIIELAGTLTLSLGDKPYVLLVLDGEMMAGEGVYLARGEAAYFAAGEARAELIGAARLAWVGTA